MSSAPAPQRPATARRTASLQRRLLTAVLSLWVLAWAATGVLTWVDARHEVSELQDAHLAQAAALLLLQPLDELDERGQQTAADLHKYQPRVVFQVWHEGQLVARSASAPTVPLAPPDARGFLDRRVQGQDWRVFATHTANGHVQMVVGELEWFRRDVVLASVRSVLTPLALMLPLAALGVWWAVRGAVRPLQALGANVAERAPQSLAPLPESGVPPEVLPLVQALNQLLDRVAHMVEAERRFTADAAHELRTPIAGIRMQAQVALGVSDAADRTAALRATLAGCDRATRLVEQLLQLARLETDANADGAECDMAAVGSTVAAWLAPQARQRNQTVVLDVAAGVPAAPVGEALAQVLLRNLLDNALRYSPDGSTVRVRIEPHAPGSGQLCVEDSGPGVPPEALDRLGERFFRVLGSGQSGSGLGWSIVQRIARLHGLRVQADTSPTLDGLRVQVRWNAPQPHA